MKYYLFARESYNLYRASLDAAMGFPCDGTDTSIEPFDTAPKDSTGRVLLAVSDQWLAPVDAEEITAAEYGSMMPADDLV